MSEHYSALPCHEQPGKQRWHLDCALRHPMRFLRSRGPRRWRYGGPPRTFFDDPALDHELHKAGDKPDKGFTPSRITRAPTPDWQTDDPTEGAGGP